MIRFPPRMLALALLALAAPLLLLGNRPIPAVEAEKTGDAPAVERARKTVHMLDDVYKTTIVLITDKYVNNKKDYPAGRAAINLFAEISKKGWHEVRLIDVSGEPYNPRNVAADAFDQEGVKQMQAGKDFYDQVIAKDGKPHLRAMTPVPVVMDKCIMCHDNYKNVKKGAAIGALTYTVPIE